MMALRKVLIACDVSGCPEVYQAFEGVADVDVVHGDPEIVSSLIQKYDAYMAALTVPFDSEMVRRASHLKVIGTPSTGTDHLDLEAIHSAKISCFDISTEQDLIRSFTATSEVAFALLLNVIRGVIPASQAVLRGDWARERFTGFQLSGKTFGVLGMGRLGKISARIARGFGMQVISNDIVELDEPAVRSVDFNELLQESDVLSIHVHLRKETKHIISASALEKMKSSAILINTSRGGLIDERALLRALNDGQIAGAGLDLIDGEWLEDIASHPLVKYAAKHDNLVITPHIGGNTYESIYGARIFMAHKIADFLRELKA